MVEWRAAEVLPLAAGIWSPGWALARGPRYGLGGGFTFVRARKSCTHAGFVIRARVGSLDGRAVFFRHSGQKMARPVTFFVHRLPAHTVMGMVPRDGLEPPSAESGSVILPLDDRGSSNAVGGPPRAASSCRT